MWEAHVDGWVPFRMSNNGRAIDAIAALRHGGEAHVDFVSPIVSTMLAAETLRGRPLTVSFDPRAELYARNTGLAAVLTGRSIPTRTGERVGRSYSPLARLAGLEDVDAALDTVAACLDCQLGGQYRSTVNEINRILGELHDNVASHARGAGFSALQVYANPTRVELAVVDAGVGLLHNVLCVQPTIRNHHAAISWCFQKGNTTAPSPDDGFAQMLPSDAPSNPYPAGVGTRATANNHLGEGLWALHQLVAALQGAMWILTGDAQLELNQQNPHGRYTRSRVHWQGVAIEVILPVETVFAAAPSPGDESVARRFGI